MVRPQQTGSRPNAAALGHLPRGGIMELPRYWRTVLNGEKEPVAIEGHVAIAVAHLDRFLQCSGRKGVFIRQVRDHRDPAAERQ
eukprot:4945617-Alexandrium_andersonii.AAC.1